MFSKAQMSGQILMYVLAIIVFGLTLLYGYKAIDYFNDENKNIAKMQFEDDMKKTIEKVQSDSRGTVKKKILVVPGGNYQHVCFVTSFPEFPDLSAPPNDQLAIMSNPAHAYPLINAHIQNAKDANMFLAPPGDIPFNIGGIKTFDGVDDVDSICVAVQDDKAILRLESEGTYVQVSAWNS